MCVCKAHCKRGLISVQGKKTARHALHMTNLWRPNSWRRGHHVQPADGSRHTRPKHPQCINLGGHYLPREPVRGLDECADVCRVPLRVAAISEHQLALRQCLRNFLRILHRAHRVVAAVHQECWKVELARVFDQGGAVRQEAALGDVVHRQERLHAPLQHRPILSFRKWGLLELRPCWWQRWYDRTKRRDGGPLLRTDVGWRCARQGVLPIDPFRNSILRRKLSTPTEKRRSESLGDAARRGQLLLLDPRGQPCPVFRLGCAGSRTRAQEKL
mmetsp:Transcript_95170/g.308156  ORF Transcript_95170/g.308156 Transcript_95170/m.308156 type:complete len:272 (-) Transcript_95170:823-1638(-)